MSYEEKDGQVILRLTHADFQDLLLVLGYATGDAPGRKEAGWILALVNRINEGNPHFLPYEIKES